MPKLEDIKVISNLESLNYIKKNNSSVVRFGDGEIDIICGHNIPYQKYDLRLAEALKMILEQQSNQELLVCLPDVFERIYRYNSAAQDFWKSHFRVYQTFYETTCQSDWYGSTFLSRPYIDLEDKSESGSYFTALRELWADRDILIVEGENSRSGIGNDLFDNTTSIQRLICPSRDAFDHYEDILEAIEQHCQDKLILIMLGPTAKLLVHALSQKGIRAIDIGHIDSEYEWYQMGATHKVKLNHKHTAEFNFDTDITPVDDNSYEEQIVLKIGLKEGNKIVELTEEKLISVIVPVYNVVNELPKCLDTLINQTYKNIEIICVNDGATDGSARILEEYAGKDERIKVVHQMNAGLSAARNTGIDHATGDYLAFIDSDDWVEDDYFEILYRNLITHEADISVANYFRFHEATGDFVWYGLRDKAPVEVFNSKDVLEDYYSLKSNRYTNVIVAWGKLYKRHIFENLRYPVGRYCEDDFTTYKAIMLADKLVFSYDPLYCYRQRDNSLSGNNFTVRRLLDYREAQEERIALLSAQGYDVSRHIEPYINKLEFVRDRLLEIGAVTEYEKTDRDLQLVKASYAKNKNQQ